MQAKVLVQFNQTAKYIFFGTIFAMLSGCITESSGGMPGPAADSERVNAQLDLARGYLENRDWARAKNPLAKALAIDSRNVEAHVLSGVVFHARNEPKLAEQHYLQALRYSPNHPQALNNYASFLYAQQRYDEAVVPLEKLVDDTSYRARAQAFENLGLSYLQVGAPDKAEGAFRRALQLNVRLPQSNLELADLALKKGQLEFAGSQFEFYNRIARPTAKSLCLGLRLAKANGDANQEARFDLSLKNLFPDAVGQCQT